MGLDRLWVIEESYLAFSKPQTQSQNNKAGGGNGMMDRDEIVRATKS